MAGAVRIRWTQARGEKKMALHVALCLYESEHCCYRDTSSSHSTNISSSSTLHRGLLSPSSTAVRQKADGVKSLDLSSTLGFGKSLWFLLRGCTVIRGGVSATIPASSQTCNYNTFLRYLTLPRGCVDISPHNKRWLSNSIHFSAAPFRFACFGLLLY